MSKRSRRRPEQLAQVFGIALLLLFSSAATVTAKCRVTLTDLLGSERVTEIRETIEIAERTFRRADDVAPEELAYSVSETLHLLRRADFINPVWPGARIYVDSYYGADVVQSSPDDHVLPSDEGFFCSLSPGRAVFLSDGSTHHYALVDSINYRDRKVVLLDPWSSVSFLLPGHNLINVNARAFVGKEGQPFLELSFDEFLRALRGSVEEFDPETYFKALEKIYPRLAGSEDYLFWKYSRLAATSSWQRSVMPTLYLSNRPELAAMKRLELLAAWANDYLVGAETKFRIPAPGMEADESEVPTRREKFLQRLPLYAQQLPWSLKWLLLSRVERSGDPEQYSKTINSFLRADPDDVDLRIQWIWFLIDEGHLDEAKTQIDQAKELWAQEVSNTISKPTAAQTMEFLFKRDYGLQSLAVLHWRNVRLQLAERIADVKANTSTTSHDEVMDRIQKQYVIGSVLLDFFPEALRSAHLAGEHDAVESYIRTVSELPDDGRRLSIFAQALYDHFISAEPISGLSPATLDVLRKSSLGGALCKLPRMFKPRTVSNRSQAFAQFCWGNAVVAEGRWAIGTMQQCGSEAYDLQVRDDGLLEILDQQGHVRSELILDQTEFGFRTQIIRIPVGPFPGQSGRERVYELHDETRLRVYDSSQPTNLVELARCLPYKAIRTDQLRKGEGLANSAMNIIRADFLQKAKDFGRESSRHRAYCGSFLAFSVDSMLSSGEYIQIQGPSGPID